MRGKNRNLKVHLSEDEKNRQPPKPYHKPYYKPHLEILGDLRTLTLGGSPGTGDSAFGGSDSEFPR